MQHLIRDRVVPPVFAEGAPNLVKPERRRQHRCLLEGEHDRKMQILKLGRREAEQVRVNASPEPPFHACESTTRL